MYHSSERHIAVPFSHLARKRKASEAIAARADHRPAQLVQPGPGRLVAAQTEHPLQAQRADAVLLAGDEPHGEKPHPQRLARVLQHRSGRQRYLPIAGSTAQQAARHFPRFAHCRAVGADKAIRPAKPPDILTARRFAAKPRVELLKRPGVINPSDRMSPSDGMSRAFHPPTLSLVSTCVKGIPSWRNSWAPAGRSLGGETRPRRSSWRRDRSPDRTISRCISICYE